MERCLVQTIWRSSEYVIIEYLARILERLRPLADHSSQETSGTLHRYKFFATLIRPSLAQLLAFLFKYKL